MRHPVRRELFNLHEINDSNMKRRCLLKWKVPIELLTDDRSNQGNQITGDGHSGINIDIEPGVSLSKLVISSLCTLAPSQKYTTCASSENMVLIR
jgi:hypothetical protein